MIPITLTSIAAGAVIAVLAGTRRLRLGTLLAMYAVLAGTLSTLAIQTLVGGLTGSWLSNAAVITQVALAIASAINGLVAVAGPVVRAVFVFFVGSVMTFNLTSELAQGPCGEELALWL